jgi:hypothetical protein
VDAPLRELLPHGAQMARPDVRGESKEVLACRIILGEVLRERAVSLDYVARAASRHYVARRAVTTARAWLHVIERQCRRRLHPPTVHAPEFVSRKDLVTRHG